MTGLREPSTAEGRRLLEDVERLRRQNHEAAAAHDREVASLRSRVAMFEAARERARELVRGSPVDWTDDPPSHEPDGWWKYTSQQNREILIGVVAAAHAAGLAEGRAEAAKAVERLAFEVPDGPSATFMDRALVSRREVLALLAPSGEAK